MLISRLYKLLKSLLYKIFWPKKHNQDLSDEIDAQLDELEVNNEKITTAIPELANPDNLKENGFLISNELLAKARQKLQNKEFKPHTIQKCPLDAEINTEATEIICINQQAYVLYENEYLHDIGPVSVYLGQNLISGQWVAIKRQLLFNETFKTNVLKENKYLLKLNELLGQAWREESQYKLECPGFSYEVTNQAQSYTVMNYYPGDSFSNIENNYTLAEKLEFALSYLEALLGFHNQGLIHNDFHCGNFRWDKENKVCHIIDYGSVLEANDYTASFCNYSVGKRKDIQPSEFYWGINSRYSDIYAAGVVLSDVFKNEEMDTINTYIDMMKSTYMYSRPALNKSIEFFQALQKTISPERLNRKPISPTQKATPLTKLFAIPPQENSVIVGDKKVPVTKDNNEVNHDNKKGLTPEAVDIDHREEILPQLNYAGCLG